MIPRNTISYEGERQLNRNFFKLRHTSYFHLKTPELRNKPAKNPKSEI